MRLVSSKVRCPIDCPSSPLVMTSGFFFPERPSLWFKAFQYVDLVKVLVIAVKFGYSLVLHVGHGQTILEIELIHGIVVEGMQIDGFLWQLEAPQREQRIEAELDIFLR